MTTDTGSTPTKASGQASPEATAASAPAEARPGRTWHILTVEGYAATGYLPGWAEADPSSTGVPLEQLHRTLADICHQATFGGQFMRICPAAVDPGEDRVVLSGSIDCHPFIEDPEPRIPVVNIQLVDDLWITNLDPYDVTDVAAAFRAFADLLDNTVAPDLITARADWETHHSGQTQPA